MTDDTSDRSYRRRTLFRTAGAALTVGSVGLAGCSGVLGNDERTLTFGIIPAEDNIDVVEQWGPVGDHLQAETDVELEFFEATDYSGIIEAMANDNVDLAWFGPFSYVLAYERAGCEAMLIWQDRDTGEAEYRSFLVTHHDDVGGIADMDGMTIAYSDPASTSGYLIPNYMMLQEGIDPDEHFAEESFAGGHASAQIALANEQVDVAAAASFIYQNMVDDGEIDPDYNQVVRESDPIPRGPIALHPDISDALREDLVDAFLSFDDEEALERLDAAGWIEADDSDYDIIRDVQTTLNEAGYEVGL